MRIIRFEDIVAWQKGQDLAVDIYQNFKDFNDWGFRNQICKAAVSISNNIAEGFDRASNIEFNRFLIIARASCSEVKSMLYLAQRLGFLKGENTTQLVNDSVEVSKIINGLMKSLKVDSKQVYSR